MVTSPLTLLISVAGACSLYQMALIAFRHACKRTLCVMTRLVQPSLPRPHGRLCLYPKTTKIHRTGFKPAGIAKMKPDDTSAPAEASVDVEAGSFGHHDHHTHYSHRAPWLRAFILGANDGLVSTASLMLGVGAGAASLQAMQLAGIAGLVAGALSMAAGEYVSVASQKDAEEADIEKERKALTGDPAIRQKEFEELVMIYVNRGLSQQLASAVASELTEKDVLRAHVRDELGIDLDDLSSACWTSALAFSMGAGMPLLAGAFIPDWRLRIMSVCLVTAAGLVAFGATGAALGGASMPRGALRVLIGGLIAMGATYGIGSAFAAIAGPSFHMSA